jgi:hypothetical protein
MRQVSRAANQMASVIGNIGEVSAEIVVKRAQLLLRARHQNANAESSQSTKWRVVRESNDARPSLSNKWR